MKKLIALLIIICSCVTVKAQLYSVTTPFKPIVKTTDSFTMHEQIEINNLSGAPLPMMWEAQFGTVFEWPFAWTAQVVDPDATHNPLNNGDTASFVLMDTAFAPNQIIIGVEHNGMVGVSNIYFKIWPLANPLDTTIIGFDITVTQGTGTGYDTYLLEKNKLVYPNPSNGNFTIKGDFNNAVLLNSNGQVILSTSSANFDVSKLAKGIYFLVLDGDLNSKIKLIKQ